MAGIQNDYETWTSVHEICVRWKITPLALKKLLREAQEAATPGAEYDMLHRNAIQRMLKHHSWRIMEAQASYRKAIENAMIKRSQQTLDI